MELWTALIWTGRIVLPIILFCIYFKLQSPSKDEIPWRDRGPTKHCYSRGKLLARRSAVVGEEAPEEISTIALKGKAQAPSLFEGRPGPGKGGGGKGGRDRGDRDREDRGPPRERRDKRERGGGDSKKTEKLREEAPSAEEAEDAVAADKIAARAPPSSADEKMHLESLLNYVAFNRKEQQRTFLLDEDTAPPPPPPKKKAAPATEKEVVSATISGATEEKANLEAQMVLRGALNFKRVDVVMDLYNQLRDSNVDITESTFTLMIEACVQASDLKKASDFLMKMETSGYNPESQLLDKVMALYSQQKSKPAPAPSGKEKAKADMPAPTPVAELPPVIPSQAPEEVLAGAGIEVVDETMTESQRQKLSSDAPIFVPGFIPPPPPSSTKPKPAGAATGGPEGAEAAGEENAEKKKEDDTAASQRTRLTASAKEFLPQFNVTFDPYMYTWTVDQSEETAAMAGEGRDGKKKGAGKAKAKAKVKAKAKAKAAATGDDVIKESKSVKESKDDKEDSDGKAKAKAKAKSSAKTWKPK